MSKHIALLRGINVGGHNSLPMKDFAALLEKVGCREVVTYIQSGNAVFAAPPALLKTLPELISKAILKAHKLQIPVVVRSAAELAKVAAKHPLHTPDADLKFLHVGFLAQKPSAAQVASLDPQRSPQDAFVVKGAEIYVRYSQDGAGKSKLTNQYIDSKLGTISTFRNWNTVQKLLELAHD